MAIAKVELECEFCHKIFERVKSEHTRNQKKGRKVFCSLSCTAKQNNIDRPPKGNPEFLVGYHNNKLDGYSPFRKYLRSARSRSKIRAKRRVKLSLQDLKEQWEAQQGICPFTGWQLVLPITSSQWPDCEEKMKASIDRIDSSLGYVTGNVQFVAQMANWAKSNLTDEDVIKFCKAVSDYRMSGYTDFIKKGIDVLHKGVVKTVEDYYFISDGGHNSDLIIVVFTDGTSTEKFSELEEIEDGINEEVEE